MKVCHCHLLQYPMFTLIWKKYVILIHSWKTILNYKDIYNPTTECITVSPTCINTCIIELKLRILLFEGHIVINHVTICSGNVCHRWVVWVLSSSSRFWKLPDNVWENPSLSLINSNIPPPSLHRRHGEEKQTFFTPFTYISSNNFVGSTFFCDYYEP